LGYQEQDVQDFLKDMVDFDLVVVDAVVVDIVDKVVVVKDILVALVVDNQDMEQEVDYFVVVAYKYMVVENIRNLLLDKAYMNSVDTELVEDKLVVVVVDNVEVEVGEQYHVKVHLEDHDFVIKV
jgi:hypothetical protein